MTQDPASFTLPNGSVVKFASPTVWDSVLFREEFGKNIDALAMEPSAVAAMSKNEKEEHEAFTRRAHLWLVWRCAAAAGCDKPFDEFWKQVPLTGDVLPKMVERAAAFFGTPPEPVTLSGSSAQVSGG